MFNFYTGSLQCIPLLIHYLPALSEMFQKYSLTLQEKNPTQPTQRRQLQRQYRLQQQQLDQQLNEQQDHQQQPQQPLGDREDGNDDCIVLGCVKFPLLQISNHTDWLPSRGRICDPIHYG